MSKIQFHRPYMAKSQIDYVTDAINGESFLDNGEYHKKCKEFFQKMYQTESFLTPSCTSALEMAAILAQVNHGDEVLLPSYTFSSTANAFLLRGANVKFVDINIKNLNIDVDDLEEKISSKTKVMCPVHYAGGPCDMEKINSLAKSNGVIVIEDAAQAIGVKYKEKFLGTWGDFGALSFHATKNIHCGEGGALLVNNDNYIEDAFVVKDKGTNRKNFHLGKVDKYSWVSIGSSYTMSDFSAAFLYSQLESFKHVNEKRRRIYSIYWDELKSYAEQEIINILPESYKQIGNGHIFSVIFKNKALRDKFISYMLNLNIDTYFHYVPLHNSEIGKKFNAHLPVTEYVADGLVRLPIHTKLSDKDVYLVIEKFHQFMKTI